MVVSALTTVDTDHNALLETNLALQQYKSTRAEEWDRLEQSARLLRLECCLTLALIHNLRCA